MWILKIYSFENDYSSFYKFKISNQRIKNQPRYWTSANNDQGILYGITYVDYTTKRDFNRSSLGKEYSAKAILERCGLKLNGKKKRNHTYEKFPSNKSLIENLQYQKEILTIPHLLKALVVLIRAEYSSDYMPNQLKNKRKKKKRSGSFNN